MRNSDRVMRYGWHLVLFVALSMAVIPGAASRNTLTDESGLFNGRAQVGVVADQSAPVRLASECSVIQPCDRKGQRLLVKKDKALLLGLLAGLSAYR